jgi:hypothetical protein
VVCLTTVIKQTTVGLYRCRTCEHVWRVEAALDDGADDGGQRS